MHQNGEDHQVCSPCVSRTDKPAEVHDEGDLADGLKGFGSGAVVDQEQHAGEALDDKEEERDAAPVVPEGLGVDGDGLVAREGGQLAEPQALVGPLINGLCGHAFNPFSRRQSKTRSEHKNH